MTYTEFISKEKIDRDRIIDTLYEMNDFAEFFHLIYSYLHNNHIEFNPRYCNQILRKKVSNMLSDERYKLLKEIP